MKQERQLLIDWCGDMIAAYRERMTDTDRAELTAWEAENLGTLGTSDWPGWKKFISKKPGSDLRLVADKRRLA